MAAAWAMVSGIVWGYALLRFMCGWNAVAIVASVYQKKIRAANGGLHHMIEAGGEYQTGPNIRAANCAEEAQSANPLARIFLHVYSGGEMIW